MRSGIISLCVATVYLFYTLEAALASAPNGIAPGFMARSAENAIAPSLVARSAEEAAKVAHKSRLTKRRSGAHDEPDEPDHDEPDEPDHDEKDEPDHDESDEEERKNDCDDEDNCNRQKSPVGGRQ